MLKVGTEKFPAREGQVVTLHPVDHDPFAPPGLEHFDPDQPEAAAPAVQAPPKKPFGLMDTWPARLAKAAWEGITLKVGTEKFPAREGQVVTLHPVDHDPFAPPGLEHFDPDQPEAAVWLATMRSAPPSWR